MIAPGFPHPHVRRVWWMRLGIALLLGCATPSRADDDEPNNGQDFTRPLTRLDFRYRFQESSGGVDKDSVIVRRDVTFHLSEGWEFVARLDVPLDWSSATSSGKTDFGLGDLLFQVAAVEKVTERFAWGAGVRATFPTATEDLFGNGKYVLSPLACARWKLPEISKGSFFEIIALYDSDVGGESDRAHLSRMRFSPTLNIALPNRWYIDLFPSQDVGVDFTNGTRWFVPADILIGRHLTDRIIAGLEVSVPVIKQFDLYDFKVEARLSFQF